MNEKKKSEVLKGLFNTELELRLTKSKKKDLVIRMQAASSTNLINALRSFEPVDGIDFLNLPGTMTYKNLFATVINWLGKNKLPWLPTDRILLMFKSITGNAEFVNSVIKFDDLHGLHIISGIIPDVPKDANGDGIISTGEDLVYKTLLFLDLVTLLTKMSKTSFDDELAAIVRKVLLKERAVVSRMIDGAILFFKNLTDGRAARVRIKRKLNRQLIKAIRRSTANLTVDDDVRDTIFGYVKHQLNYKAGLTNRTLDILIDHIADSLVSLLGGGAGNQADTEKAGVELTNILTLFNAIKFVKLAPTSVGTPVFNPELDAVNADLRQEFIDDKSVDLLNYCYDLVSPVAVNSHKKTIDDKSDDTKDAISHSNKNQL